MIPSTSQLQIGQILLSEDSNTDLQINSSVLAIATGNNILTASGTLNNFQQINVTNTSNGTNASSDLVCTNDIGTQTTYYVDLGINSSQYTGQDIGNTGDSYLYSQANDFYIGNTVSGYRLYLFAGTQPYLGNQAGVTLFNNNIGINNMNPLLFDLDISGQQRIILNGLVGLPQSGGISGIGLLLGNLFSGTGVQVSPSLNFSGNNYITGTNYTGNSPSQWRIYSSGISGNFSPTTPAFLSLPRSYLCFDNSSGTGNNFNTQVKIDNSGNIILGNTNFNNSGISIASNANSQSSIIFATKSLQNGPPQIFTDAGDNIYIGANFGNGKTVLLGNNNTYHKFGNATYNMGGNGQSMTQFSMSTNGSSAVFQLINTNPASSGTPSNNPPQIWLSGNIWSGGNLTTNWLISTTGSSGISPTSNLTFSFSSGTNSNLNTFLSLNSNGFLGVNNSNPQYTLDVNGTASFSQSGLGGLPQSGNTTSGIGVLLGNTTPASFLSGGIKPSPSLNFSGNYYATGNITGSFPMVWRIYATGNSGIAGITNQQLNFDYNSGFGGFAGGANGIFFNYNGNNNQGKISAFILSANATVTAPTIQSSTQVVTSLINPFNSNSPMIFNNNIGNTSSVFNLFTPLTSSLVNTGSLNFNVFSGNYKNIAGSGIYCNVLIAPNYNFSGAQSGITYDLRVNSTSLQLSGATHYLLDVSNSGNSALTVLSSGTNGPFSTGFVGINQPNPQANLHVSGTHRYDGVGNGTPLNTVTPVNWLPVNVSGVGYFIPLYQ